MSCRTTTPSLAPATDLHGEMWIGTCHSYISISPLLGLRKLTCMVDLKFAEIVAMALFGGYVCMRSSCLKGYRNSGDGVSAILLIKFKIEIYLCLCLSLCFFLVSLYFFK